MINVTGDMKMTFNSQALRKLRLEKNISQEELAFAIQAEQRNISLLENDKIKNPSLGFIAKIAAFLNVTVDYFILH